MHLRDLELYRFRNLRNQRITFSSRFTVIVGRNAQGKTGLLEAAYLLGNTRSFRPAKLQDLISWEDRGTVEPGLEGGVEAAVQGNISGPDGDYAVRYEITRGSRQVFINDKKVTSASHFFGRVRLVEFSPDDLFLIKGAPALRRNFLDRVLASVDPAYVDNLVQYNRALRSRNALLSRHSAHHTTTVAGRQAALEIESWTKPLIERGRALAVKRYQLAQYLGAKLSEIYARLVAQGVAGAPRCERAAVSYRSDFLKRAELAGGEEMEERYREVLNREIALGATVVGVHRDDIALVLDTGCGEKKARHAASQGQTRCVALGLKMAAIEYLREHAQDDPIILLDDVESELDESRRTALVSYVLGLKSQVIIATTNPGFIPKEAVQEMRFLTIENGLIRDN